MALFNRQKNSTVPAELQPYYDAPRSGPRGWLRWLVRIVALLIVIGALVVGGRWGWQKIDKNDTKVGITSSQQKSLGTHPANKPTPNASSSNTNKGTVKSTDESTSTNSTTTPSTPSAPSPSTSGSSSSNSQASQSAASNTQSSTPKALANSGPGDTTLLFSVVTLAGVAVYQVYLRLKQRLGV